MVPTARTDLRDGTRVDLLYGINFHQPSGKLKGHSILVEAGLPIYQRLHGPQLETDARFTIGWQYAF